MGPVAKGRVRSALGAALLAGWLGGAIGLAGVPGLTGVAGAITGCATTGTTVTCKYSYTGAQQTFTVPSGVSTVHVSAVGAPGAPATGSTPNHGGVGGTASATVTVTPGSTVYVEVGGAGIRGTTGTSGAGGWNGGGAGVENGNGGGGASDVRTVSCASTCATGGTASSLASRVVVAGGGGGGGMPSPDQPGAGSSGGNAASSGEGGIADGKDNGGVGGGAGTPTAGGAGGTKGTYETPSGTDGTAGAPGAAGHGGSGGDGGQADNGGGGGGGGLYGGGGGGGGAASTTGTKASGGGGGGGGSSYAPGGTTGVASSLSTSPSVTISYTEVLTAVILYVRAGSTGSTCTSATASDACAEIQTAVTKAETFGSSTTVLITVGPGTYTGGITIAASGLTSLTLTGAGASTTTVTGHGSTRDFDLSSGAVTITGIAVDNGAADHGDHATTLGGGVYVQSGVTAAFSNDSFTGDAATFGGGVSDYGNAATLTHDTFSADHALVNGGGFTNSYVTATLTDDTFSDDSAASIGGGIGNWGKSTITHDTFSDDSAQIGGGVGNDSIGETLGIATLADDTFSDDSATYGGGVSNSGTPYVRITLTDDTLSGDEATVSGGGVYNGAGTATLSASIFDASTCAGSFSASSIYNVTSTTTCKTGSTSERVTTLHLATELKTTPTYPTAPATLALRPGSAAIDEVVCTLSGLPSTDERGVLRPTSGKLCDAGAYQLQKLTPAITSPATGATESSPTVEVSGSAAPTATIVVTVSGTEPSMATTTADGDGTWSTTLTALKGTDTLVATEQTLSSKAVHITVESNTLVVNGDFGTPTVAQTNHVSQLASIPGWASTNSCTIELQSQGAHGVKPYTGDNQYAALASSCTSGVSQTIATTPGQDYVLSFAYRSQPTTPATKNTMSVAWGTSPINWGTSTSPITTLQGTTTGLYDGWRVAEDIVKASSSTTKLEFADATSAPTAQEGDFLDAVSLAPFYPAKAKNTSWQSALTISAPSGTTSATRALAFSGEHLWYKFQVEPDEQLSVHLSNVAADYDLLLFSDITAAYAADTTPRTAADLTELAAESPTNANAVDFSSAGLEGGSAGLEGGSAGLEGGSAGLEGGSAGLEGGSAGLEGGSAGLEGGSAGLEGGPAGLIAGSAGLEGGSAGLEGGSAGLEGGSAGLEGGAAQLALEQTFIGLSQEQGAVTKTVNADTFNSSGVYYAEVIGLNGASSPTAFTIAVTRTNASCATVTSNTLSIPVPTTRFPTSTRGTLSGKGTDYTTVILTDSQTMPAVTMTSSLTSEIGELAHTTNGVVVNVGKSTAVRTLTAVAESHPTCPYAVNREADAIQNIVNSYRSGTNLKYVVIVGGDTVIPFFRYADQETVEPEAEFTHVISLTTHTEAESALQNDYYLTDDPYGAAAAITIDDSILPLQTAAVGRLVQTPKEIESTIKRYLATETGKVIKVTSSMSAGYSFMARPASTIATTFATEETGITGASNTQLITNDGVPSSTIGTGPTRSWTASKLSTKLTSKSHQLVFIGAHFNSKVMLAADHTSGIHTYLTTTTFSEEIGTHLDDALVLSAGCHSGYNVNPAESVVGTTVAWPEAFAEAGATLIAGSGYQYSDVNYVADSDQVYADLAKQLDYRQTTGAVHIGTALLHTEWEYLASLESLDGLSEKSLLQVTLYGLPMLRIQFGTSAAKTAPGVSTSVIGASTVTEVATGPGRALGLEEAPLHVTAAITPTPIKPSTTVGTPTRVYYKGPAGVTSEPGTPVVPVQTADVSVSKETLRGVGLWKGTYTDENSAQPLVGDPAAETPPTPPAFSSSVYAPAKIWNPNYFGTLTNGTGTTLGITPIQYVTTPSNPARATMRKYSTLALLLFYSSATGTAAGAPAPEIGDVTITTAGATVTVSAEVPGNEAAGVQEVWTTYTDPAVEQRWTSKELFQTPASPTTWKAAFSDPNAASSDFMVQAANGVGEVSLDNNTGAYFTPAPASQPTPAKYTLSLTPASGAYGTIATVTATLTATKSSGDAAHRPVSFSIETKGATAYTLTTGTATAHISLAGLVPGTYPMSASFAGDGADSPAYAQSTFEVTRASTTLVVSAPSTLQSGKPSGVTATLESNGHPLGQESVFFTVTNPTHVVVTSSVGTTTNAGIAQAGTLDLPAGDVGPGYTVHAYFATPKTPTTAGNVNASLLGYTAFPASATHTTTVTDGTNTTLLATPSPATFGQTIRLTATVSPTGTSSSAWPTGTGTTYPTGTVTFKNGSTVLGKAPLTLSSTGSATATFVATGLQGGTHTLTASYAGNTYLVPSSATTKEAVGFTETISGSKSGSLVVTKGEVILITGSVSGSISVESGGGLEVDGGTVSGAISATGAVGFTLCGATVGGAISVSASTGSVLIGGGTTGCAKSTVSGAISLSGNKGPVEVATSTISGPVSLSGNTGGVVLVGSTISGAVSVSSNKAPTGSEIEISADKISGSLSCSGNTPPPTDAGKPNTVSGARSGQCDSPKNF